MRNQGVILKVRNYFNSRKVLIEDFIKERMNNYSCPDFLKNGMSEVMLREDDKERGIFLFAVYESLMGRNNTGAIKKMVPVAVAIEYIYSGLFLHEHLPIMNIYGSNEWHKKCQEKFGFANVVLIGDALLTEGFAILSELSKPKMAAYCVKALSDAFSSKGSIAGYVVESSSIGKKIKENVLKYIHTKKTASIYRAIVDIACEFHGEVSQEMAFDLKEYALNFAVAKEILKETVLYVEMKEGSTKVKRIEDKLLYPDIEGLDRSIKAIRRLLKTAQDVIEGFGNNQILLEFLNKLRYDIP